MGVSRRDFLKLSGSAALVASLGVNLDPAKAYAKELRIKNAKQSTTVCPYCSVGCGIIVYAENGKIFTSAQVGRPCEFKVGEISLMVMTLSNETRIQPNATCPEPAKS